MQTHWIWQMALEKQILSIQSDTQTFENIQKGTKKVISWTWYTQEINRLSFQCLSLSSTCFRLDYLCAVRKLMHLKQFSEGIAGLHHIEVWFHLSGLPPPCGLIPYAGCRSCELYVEGCNGSGLRSEVLLIWILVHSEWILNEFLDKSLYGPNACFLICTMEYTFIFFL